MTTITALPAAPNRATDDAATFSSKADTFVAALQTFRTETNLVATETNTASSDAMAAAAAATSVSGATAWAGTAVSYTLGDAVWSGINFKTYRLSIASKAANVSNTDPSVDTASWTLVNGTGDVFLTAAQTLENKTLTNPVINGFTGGTGIVNLGSGQFYKSATGNVGIGTSSPSSTLDVRTDDATTNAVTRSLALSHTTTGTAANGIGSGIIFQQESTTGALRTSAYIDSIFTDATDASLASALTFTTRSGGSLTERLRIDSAGNVGIGTASPLVQLDVKGATDTHVGITASGVDEAIILAYDDGGIRTTNLSYAAASHKFLVNTTERMRIDASGNLGLGVAPVAYTTNARTFQLDGGANPAQIRLTNNTTGSAQTNGGLLSMNGTQFDIWNVENDAIRFGTNNVESARITSGGDVGIGTTDPTGGYTWNAANRILGVSGDASASISAYGVIALTNNRATPAATDAFGILGFTSQNSVAGQKLKAYIAGFAQGAGGVTGGYGGGIGFYTKPDNSATAATERMRIDDAGNVLVGLTTAVSGGANLQTVDGITFPATAVASANVNTLDDYEEGTFTPTIVGTVAGTGTYSIQVGRYTKIGNRVFFVIQLAWSAHTGTGNMSVAGLPFTTNATANNNPAYVVYTNGMALTANNTIQCYSAVSSTQIVISQVPVGGGTATSVAMDTAVASFLVSGHYEV